MKQPLTQSPMVIIEAGHEKELFTQLMVRLRSKNTLSLNELLSIYHSTTPEPTIPVTIFSGKLKPAEALCKYLKEELRLSNKEIAEILGRETKSIWATYARAVEKRIVKGSKINLVNFKEDYVLPLSLFAKSKCSILENVVWYLNTMYHLHVKVIATLLGSTANSIRILLLRAERKHGKN